MLEELKPGDVVTLKSGGPPMTISSVNIGTSEAHVVWFDTGRIVQGVIPLAALMLTDPPYMPGPRPTARLPARL